MSKELGLDRQLDTKSVSENVSVSGNLSDNLSYEEEVVAIDYKNCSWQKAAGLLFSEYICLAIMSFPWSYSVLGLVPGLILTVFVSLTVLYTGLIITDYCIAYPHITNICDIGQHLFGNSKWVWYATAVCFLLNNTLIQALHVLVGAKYLNTITDNYGIPGTRDICSIGFAVVAAVVCFLVSLPRTFSSMSSIAYFSAITMFLAVVLSMVFAGVEFDIAKDWYSFPVKGTTYVDGMTAFLNIVYTFVGQITYPSFISEMRNPKEFKKALYIVTLAELITFALAGSIIYVYVGTANITAPAFGSLTGNHKKIAFSFALPTIIFLGSLYSNVSSQFVFLKIFDENSKHRNSHTLVGWSTWIVLNAVLWVFAFVLAQVIPFFSDLLSLMSSLFDCWFGFVFWGVAYFKLKKHHDPDFHFWPYFKSASIITKLEFIANIFLIIIGFYILGPGLYATIQSIVLSYQSGAFGHPFSCASNAI
ncbi:hypothetical protein JCM33374_g1561 [Metschnikowia sp. JCM 33374]|nr:hypothetical protein JCM33374_g1561 [Metschnikowia sp. JCM 33374]